MSETECGLARAAAAGMVTGVMSAAEIIELIKQLPPEEKAEVTEFLRNGVADSKASEIKFATDADFDRAAKRVFAENHELLRRLAQ